MSSNSYDSQSSLILDAIKTNHPETVSQLARILAENRDFDETAYVDTMKRMVKNGSIRLDEPTYEIYSVLDFLFTITVSGWFWLILLLACTAMIAVYVNPVRFPLSILRWIFGSILLCLPGYATIRLLFLHPQLPQLEQLGLSLALSLAIIPIIGFVLNFTPWGIRFFPIIISLGAYTLLVGTAAASRNYFDVVRVPE